MHARCLVRLYWVGCGAAIVLGFAFAVLILQFPPEEFDDEGRLIGEMPPAFGAAMMLVLLGLAGACAGLAAAVARWLWRRFFL